MGKILFITVDEQRFDALGCTGGKVAKTPNLDDLAKNGINFRNAYVNNVTCMPSRSTMITGQHPATHGVFSNGVPLPTDAPSVARYLQKSGYHTALIGKAHLEPVMGAPEDFWEVRSGSEHDTGPYRGFNHVQISSHGKGVARNHYQVWMEENCPEEYDHYLSQTGANGKLNTAGGGDTNAIQVHHNPIAKEFYHSYWLADRSVEWLKECKQYENWFLWLSFGDPHHPYQPPKSEIVDGLWKDLDLPNAHPGSAEKIIDILDKKPAHWKQLYMGEKYSCGETPNQFVANDMSNNQVREINHMVHTMNEIVDDSIGRVLAQLDKNNWLEDTDVFFTSDHGSFQGDYGLMFKGPFHVDSLMKVPLLWKPAKRQNIKPTEIKVPVSLVDLAPSFCKAAGIEKGDWMQGSCLPLTVNEKREFIICEWEQEHLGNLIKISTIATDKHICSVYEKTNWYPYGEGELYSYETDSVQWNNLWTDPDYKSIKNDLVDKLMQNLPTRKTEKLTRVAPA